MSAFRVSVNGRPWFDSDDLTSLTMAVEALKRSRTPRISLHASARGGAMQWLDAELQPGDAITIDVLDQPVADVVSGCSFCGRQVDDTPSLVGSRTIQICRPCVDDFAAALGQNAPLPEGASFRDDPELACGICGRHPKDIPGVIFRHDAAICPQCVHACVDLAPRA